MKNDNRSVIKISILIISVLIVLFSFTYAFLNQTVTGTKSQVITSGNLKLTLNEGNELTLNNALPMYDEVGMIQEPFTFKVVNDGKVPINYVVRLVDVTLENTEKLDTNIVKYGLTKDGVNTIDLLSNLQDMLLDEGMIVGNQTIEYSLRLWIDFHVEDEALINGKSLSYRIDIEAGQVDGTERKIQFDSNGGILDETSKTVVVGERYGTLPTPTKAEYNFLGWFNEQDEYVDENSLLDSFTKKLVAKWRLNQCTVAFNPNGGSVSLNNKQVKFNEEYGELPIPTKTDSIFLGWFTGEFDGEKIESTTVMNIAENHTLYAHWKDPYQDKSGASRPVLSKELIPVKIANNGEVRKADIYEEWYDYNQQIWANAVVLENDTVNYNTNDVIPESNIESYFVWIPRYRYKIFNTGNYTNLYTSSNDQTKTIEIEFESKDTVSSKGTTVNTWLSHPAFQAFDSNGFWVGKFENGYRGATSSSGAQKNVGDSSKLIIKPNVYSWRYINIGNMFKVSFDYLRNSESHMMKNTEWGAVAYLHHSNYGSRKSVRVNNNSSYLTGYAAVEEPTLGYNKSISIAGNKIGTTSDITQPYNTEVGYTASTTGNISGVYDMSGGAGDIVLGYNIGSTVTEGMKALTYYYPDFFSNDAWTKYYDKYENDSSSATAYNKRILGDATGEMGIFYSDINPANIASQNSIWYGDYAYSITQTAPFYWRGGRWFDGRASGIFAFLNFSGDSLPKGDSFRTILVP